MARRSQPTDLSDLRGRIAELRGELRPRAASVLDYAFSNPFALATGTARDLAAACDVPPAAISRLVRRLGFERFANFRDVFKQMIRAEVERQRHTKAAAANASGLVQTASPQRSWSPGKPVA